MNDNHIKKTIEKARRDRFGKLVTLFAVLSFISWWVFVVWLLITT